MPTWFLERLDHDLRVEQSGPHAPRRRERRDLPNLEPPHVEPRGRGRRRDLAIESPWQRTRSAPDNGAGADGRPVVTHGPGDARPTLRRSGALVDRNLPGHSDEPRLTGKRRPREGIHAVHATRISARAVSALNEARAMGDARDPQRRPRRVRPEASPAAERIVRPSAYEQRYEVDHPAGCPRRPHRDRHDSQQGCVIGSGDVDHRQGRVRDAEIHIGTPRELRSSDCRLRARLGEQPPSSRETCERLCIGEVSREGATQQRERPRLCGVVRSEIVRELLRSHHTRGERPGGSTQRCERLVADTERADLGANGGL